MFLIISAVALVTYCSWTNYKHWKQNSSFALHLTKCTRPYKMSCGLNYWGLMISCTSDALGGTLNHCVVKLWLANVIYIKLWKTVFVKLKRFDLSEKFVSFQAENHIILKFLKGLLYFHIVWHMKKATRWLNPLKTCVLFLLLIYKLMPLCKYCAKSWMKSHFSADRSKPVTLQTVQLYALKTDPDSSNTIWPEFSSWDWIQTELGCGLRRWKPGQ